MKNTSLLLFSTFFLLSCSNNTENKEPVTIEHDVHATYDTAAVDSFSSGAISVDVARQIRMSSVAYQDSLKKVAARIDSTKKVAAAKAKEEASQKEQTQKEKKKESDKPKAEIKAAESGTN